MKSLDKYRRATYQDDELAQVNRQCALAEQELVENFIYHPRERIEEAWQRLDYLNDTLKELPEPDEPWCIPKIGGLAGLVSRSA